MRTGWRVIGLVAGAVATAIAGATGCGGGGGGPSSFADAVEVAVGNLPLDVAIADLNGDGLPDVVVANSGTDDVSILVNTTAPGATTPSFEPSVDVPVAPSPFAVLVVDLNADDKPDVVTPASGADVVTVLLNTTADGATAPTFADAVDFPTESSPADVDAADFDGDGALDLAVVARGADAVLVLRNDTAPGALTPVFTVVSGVEAGMTPRFLVAGDLGGDDQPDLAVMTEGDDDVAVYVNTKTETDPDPIFSDGIVVGTFLVPSAFDAGELNGDGQLDLVIATGDTNSVSAYVNVSTGQSPVFAGSGDANTGLGPFTLAAGDLDADGLDDVAVANYIDGTVTVLRNRTPPDSELVVLEPEELPTGEGPFSIAIGDLNSDGKADLAVAANTVDTVAIHLAR
jgi:hypothetical protein